ncbi:MAG: Uma2 family endonuclease, partial [Armatimonadetes bacterium]|nr:Uma2 family endonuclease [Armatimonadota bacterium]
GEDGKVHGVPNLVVEIVSPGNPTRDRVTKFRAYHDEGVEWLWLIDSESLDVEEYQLLEGRYVSAARCARGQTFHPGVFPGCAIDLDALMSE